MSDAAVLIISTVADVATDAVVRSLLELGVEHRRVNTEDYPFQRSLTIDFGQGVGAVLNFDGRWIRPASIWYRRVRSPSCPEGMDGGIYDFCVRENRAALLGGALGQRVRWMSDPGCVWRAEFKAYQLQVALEVGLRIPKTVITSSPDAVRRAFDEFGPLVVKPARSGHFKNGGEEFSIFTSRVDEEHLAELDDVRWTPSIYQELVEKTCDIRTTYVGGTFFSAAIHSQTDPSAAVDWRRTDNPDLPHSAVVLPGEVTERLERLMNRLGLEFGCIDLVLTPKGEYVFLEVNPSGQWLWIDDQLNLGISSAVAKWLAGSSP